MKIELTLQQDDGPFEYDVWGGYLDQEDGDHYATFDDFDAAIEYKAEMEGNNPNLQLSVARRKVQP